ncbi:MAG: class I SAM-dependent methyltransferase, partial [Candidatus Aminicenantes bacterium]
PSATRGALFEKTAPLDPPQKLFINQKFLRGGQGGMVFTKRIPPWLPEANMRKILRKIYHLFFKKKKITGIRYWKRRARKHGQRSVFNLQHPEEELAVVTQMQKDKLFPILEQHLNGDERLVLDFGCGPGRFTHDLAQILKGKAIGVDPIKHLLDLAPKYPDVQYQVMKEANIPIENDSIDVAWICIVLGGITNEKVLKKSIAEIDRVLKKQGLVFLVENTSDQPDQPHWKYRSVQMYQQLFKFAGLKHISDYIDVDERISIMVGRKK